MSWDDYRFNGLRVSLQEARGSWATIRDTAHSQDADISFLMRAVGQVEGLETALRLLDTWVLAIQEEESKKTT